MVHGAPLTMPKECKLHYCKVGQRAGADGVEKGCKAKALKRILPKPLLLSYVTKDGVAIAMCGFISQRRTARLRPWRQSRTP